MWDFSQVDCLFLNCVLVGFKVVKGLPVAKFMVDCLLKNSCGILVKGLPVAQLMGDFSQVDCLLQNFVQYL